MSVHTSHSPISESVPLLPQNYENQSLSNENTTKLSLPAKFPKIRNGNLPLEIPPCSNVDTDMKVMGGNTLQYASPSKNFVFIRFLPVFFVIFIISTLYCIYLLYHCFPLLQIHLPHDKRNIAAFYRGLFEIIAFHILFILLLISYFLAIFTYPGNIPNDDEWNAEEDYEEENGCLLNEAKSYQSERKRKGGRRQCKWCWKLKPDRAHHCRVCRCCILKMDHHCPLIYNCVGWRNHKYFMLSLLYASLSIIYVSVTMFESVKKTLDQPIVRFGEMFLLLFGETLDMFLGVIVIGFFFFHVWLLSNGLTTIEFCEKQTSWSFTEEKKSLWDRGCWNNFKDVFGANPFLWFLPIDNRVGDGINFIRNPATISKEVEKSNQHESILSRLDKSMKNTEYT